MENEIFKASKDIRYTSKKNVTATNIFKFLQKTSTSNTNHHKMSYVKCETKMSTW